MNSGQITTTDDRWWRRLVWFASFATLVWAGAGAIFGTIDGYRFDPVTSKPAPGQPPLTKATPTSLSEVHMFTHIPWPAWGIVFWALAAGLCIPGLSRALCNLTAGMLCLFFITVVAYYTFDQHHATNLITVPFSFLAPFAFFAGFRYAMLYERRRRVRR